MCQNPKCVYCEIIELPTCYKMFIHYNSLFIPIWIEFCDIEDNMYSYFAVDKNKPYKLLELEEELKKY